MGKRERKAALEARRVALEAEEADERARRVRVLEIIERAYDGVPPPDEEHLTFQQAEAWDTYRRVDQRRDHHGRWQDLPESQYADGKVTVGVTRLARYAVRFVAAPRPGTEHSSRSRPRKHPGLLGLRGRGSFASTCG